MKKKISLVIPLIVLVIFLASPVNAAYEPFNDIDGFVYEDGVPKEGLKVEVWRIATGMLEGYGVNDDGSKGELGTDYTDINGYYHVAWLYSAYEWYLVKVYTPCGVIEVEVQVPCSGLDLDFCYTCEEGKSPGYWRKAFNAFSDLIIPGEKAQGAIKEAWADLVMWTAAIDLASRSLPTPWGLPPLAEIDYDGDGTFEMEDAWNIFNDHGKPWNQVWIGVANWYNWAAGYPPYAWP